MNALRQRTWLAARSLLLAAASAASAATVSSEAFDYPDGSNVAGQSGGSGWAAGWTALSGNGTIVSEGGSLTYPGLATTGGKMHFRCLPVTGTTTTTYRSPDPAITGGTHYIRFLAQNLNEGRRYFGLGLFNATSERALLGQSSGFGYWTLNHVDGITNALFTNVLVSAVDSSDAALLVLKLELRDGPERVTLWVNPDLSQPESTAGAVGASSFLTDQDYGAITRFRMGGGGYSATFGDPTEHVLDEIAISPVSPFAPPGIGGTTAGGVLSLFWPAEYLGWTLQTNLVGTGEGPAWGDLPDTRSVTSTNLPMDGADPAAYFRLRSP